MAKTNKVIISAAYAEPEQKRNGTDCSLSPEEIARQVVDVAKAVPP
jgi:hypothetical protein